MISNISDRCGHKWIKILGHIIIDYIILTDHPLFTSLIIYGWSGIIIIFFIIRGFLWLEITCG